jgi:hypothetical protein
MDEPCSRVSHYLSNTGLQSDVARGDGLEHLRFILHLAEARC